MCIEDAELKAPRHREVLNVGQVDLIERAVVPARVVAVGHDPLLRVVLEGDEALVGERDPGDSHAGNDRQDQNPPSFAIYPSAHFHLQRVQLKLWSLVSSRTGTKARVSEEGWN